MKSVNILSKFDKKYRFIGTYYSIYEELILYSARSSLTDKIIVIYSIQKTDNEIASLFITQIRKF